VIIRAAISAMLIFAAVFVTAVIASAAHR